MQSHQRGMLENQLQFIFIAKKANAIKRETNLAQLRKLIDVRFAILILLFQNEFQIENEPSKYALSVVITILMNEG